MKKAITKDDKIVRLRTELNAGDTLKDLIEHPVFTGFFHAYEQALIEKMLEAKVDDHTSRRNAALEINVLRKFRQMLIDTAHKGDRARKDLEKIERQDNAR